jgi:Ca2+-transporting ATPase
VERNLTLLGVVGIVDPPRPEVTEAIKMARAAGIGVVMITGDAPATALAIADRVGLGASRAVTGPELADMDDTAVRDALARRVVFARTTPEHKLRIVKILQDLGHIVGMTGDGVNDAPALKQADIGIAMGRRGTDVARGASDMIITDDNFASIVGAVQEGRRQYDNIQKFVHYLLSSNMGEVVAVFASVLVGGPLILLPVQILWMNLVTDGMTALALGVEPAEAGLMRRPPRDPKAHILDRMGILMILVLGGYIGVVALWLFHGYGATHGPGSVARAQTMALAGIIVVETMSVFAFRALRGPLVAVGVFSNPWILVAVMATFGLQACAVYVPFLQRALHTVPLGWSDWGLMLLAGTPILLATEMVKWWRWGAPARSVHPPAADRLQVRRPR